MTPRPHEIGVWHLQSAKTAFDSWDRGSKKQSLPQIPMSSVPSIYDPQYIGYYNPQTNHQPTEDLNNYCSYDEIKKLSRACQGRCASFRPPKISMESTWSWREPLNDGRGVYSVHFLHLLRSPPDLDGISHTGWPNPRNDGFNHSSLEICCTRWSFTH